LRRAFPVYHGVARLIVISEKEGNRIGRAGPESLLLKEADRLAQKLNPARSSPLKGGIRFKLVGAELPAEVVWDANIDLWDLRLRKDHRFMPSCRVPFVKNAAEIGVAAGEYRIAIEGTNASYSGQDAARAVRMIEWELDDLPGQVAVKDAVIDVPIRLRKLAELALVAPAAGATFDPNVDALQWRPVEGASKYRVFVRKVTDRAGARSAEYLPPVETTALRVVLGALSDPQAAVRAKSLEAGASLDWSVDAVDAKGRRIAVCEETGRPLLLSKGIAER
ncbi:MAG TPA: hypothetical protein VNC50_15835, partial [Planctomycetia bacterium]|nr:hypothetical protein [Planctomycetia bacterium]